MIQTMIRGAVEGKTRIQSVWNNELTIRGENEYAKYLDQTEKNNQIFETLFSYFTDFQKKRTENLEAFLSQLLDDNWPAVYLNMTIQSFRNAIAAVILDESIFAIDINVFYKTLNEWLDAVVNLISHLAELKNRNGE
ncbi:hypothetical protein J9317_10735 [Metabacillus sp. KIGAM252]|uniref:RsbS co-antagonist protein RsbRA N-terminal domain-containing protein n=1 Tax=Metabacillus flavus TaxID=2823519 RepID=A0ABS5LF61_9BACI|nr:hypothetical protein [Metabacillus flavus]MBS2969239.1 hypothetical protein [Metabacillus flavus]